MNLFHLSVEILSELTLILLTWIMWRASNNVSRWQIGFNLAFKWLICPWEGRLGVKQVTVYFNLQS